MEALPAPVIKLIVIHSGDRFPLPRSGKPFMGICQRRRERANSAEMQLHEERGEVAAGNHDVVYFTRWATWVKSLLFIIHLSFAAAS